MRILLGQTLRKGYGLSISLCDTSNQDAGGYGKNGNIPKFNREFSRRFPETSYEISPKSFYQGFLLKLSHCQKNVENSSEDNFSEIFVIKYLILNRSQNYFYNSNTVLVNMRFRFCSAAESCQKDDTVLYCMN